jgi:ADP-heptose:LPS heptosyltransferase
MESAQSLKYRARRLFLKSLRLAARPSWLYPTLSPDTSKPPRRLLVIRPDHLGDVLLSTPALALLRKALPDTEITVLVGPWGAPSLAGNPDVDKIIRVEFPGFTRQPKTNFMAPYLYALQQSRLLRQNGYDAAISLRYDFWWGALLAYLSDIPARFGYDWQESNPFLNFRLGLAPETLPLFLSPYHQPYQHFTSLSLSLAQFLLQIYNSQTDSGDFDARLRFYPSPEDRRYINLRLGELGIGREERLVAIHPGTGATIKLWTVEGFGAVSDAIAQHHRVRVLLVGSQKEAILLKNIARHCRIQHTILDNVETWGRLGALFERSDLVVGLDSGPLHLAVATGTPTIHLFGPTDPAIFGPWGDPKRHLVVRSELDLPCCPCGVLDSERVCWKGGFCMRTIKVPQVMEAVGKLL